VSYGFTLERIHQHTAWPSLSSIDLFFESVV